MRSWVEISTSQIVRNLAAIRSAVGPDVEVMPVLKADAYNHGAVAVARALRAASDARLFAVATVSEGVELRAAGIDCRIVIMGGVLPDERETVIEKSLTPVLHSLDEIREFSALAAKAATELRYHLKIDTGLTRLGTLASCEEIAQAMELSPHAVCEGVMTHLASAENFESPQTEEQIAQFEVVCEPVRQLIAPPAWLHTAASSAIAWGRRESWKTLVRPGLALYGYVSRPVGEPRCACPDVAPALTWKAAVIAVKDVPANRLVGYNGRFRTERPTRIAVLGVGYADGYPHQLGNKGQVIINGAVAPVIGAVSMDLLTIDVTDCPPAAPGDAAILLGRTPEASVDAQHLADLAGVIPYAILCGIGRRPARVYVD